MKVVELNIGSTPALIIGEKSEKVFLFVHGLHGRKEEALAFAEVAVPKGYQVLGIDLPVERKPWEVLPLLNDICDYLYDNWQSVSVRANSIGSWFTLLAFQSKKVEQALLVSPILDMKRFFELMPQREDDYYETKTTRDREIVQPSVLEMLNWNTMRVYSIDWYENRERVMQQILDQIKATGQNRKKQPADAQQEVKAFDATALQPKNTEPVVRNAGMLPYMEADISAYDVSKEDFYLRNQVSHDILLDILTVEQPVCHNYLCKRLAKSFGVGHGRAAIELIIKYSTRGCCKVKAQVGSDYYFISRKVAENYHSYRCKSPRTIGEIPQIEIENALMEVVREEFSLPVEKIPTLVAKKLGFYSAASKIKQAVSQVMELLAEQNRIVLKNDFAIMPDDLDSKV